MTSRIPSKARTATGRRQGGPQPVGLAKVLVGALLLGAAFGAATAVANAVSHHSADLESRAYTSSGISAAEVVSTLLDSGWAWAGSAVAVGWLVTRTEKACPAALARGAAAGVLALFAATTAYTILETIQSSGPSSPPWYEFAPVVWWIGSLVLGAPLGAVGACAARPGAVGLLARSTVPVGAAVQMAVLPPGRNEVVVTTGRAIVWTAAAAAIAFIVVRFLGTNRRGTAGPTSPPGEADTQPAG